jgi:Sec-independent protein translocase protein TatA
MGPWELLMIVLAMELLLGASRLQRMVGSLGEGIGRPCCTLHERSQLGNPDATLEAGNDSPPGR